MRGEGGGLRVFRDRNHARRRLEVRGQRAPLYCAAPHGVTTGALVGDHSIKTIRVGLLAGLLYEMLKQQRTAGEQAATILLPNCLILDCTGSGDKVPRSEKSPINKGFLVRYVTRTDVYNRITKPLLYR